jgi:hypothetical protein
MVVETDQHYNVDIMDGQCMQLFTGRGAGRRCVIISAADGHFKKLRWRQDQL